MANKVQLIKEEIERLKHTSNAYDRSRFMLLLQIEDFINSLQEEHNEDLEKEISNYIKDNFFGSKSMGFLSNRTKGELDSIDVVNIARHFAEWQKQQMMKNTVDGEVVYQIGSADIAPTDIQYKVVSDKVYIPNVKLGDKVKIIIIKTEQQ